MFRKNDIPVTDGDFRKFRPEFLVAWKSALADDFMSHLFFCEKGGEGESTCNSSLLGY